MPILNARQTAAYLDIPLEELLRSRGRGLPPGNLGFKLGGRLLFDTEDLLPEELSKLTVPELRARLDAAGIPIPAKAKKATLLRLLTQ